jgi:hypothetical protein
MSAVLLSGEQFMDLIGALAVMSVFGPLAAFLFVRAVEAVVALATRGRE